MVALNISYESARALYEIAKARKDFTFGEVPMWRELAEQLREKCDDIPEWTASRNCIRLAGNGWMVSYKEHPTDSDKPETALIDRRSDDFYILSGDHRQAYKAAAAGGWEALHAVYLSLKDQFTHEVE